MQLPPEARHRESTESTGRPTRAVAHELNNALASILAAAQYALRCCEDDDAPAVFHEALVKIEAEAKRCRSLARRALEASTREG